MKKVLSLMLTLLMVFSSVPVFAADENIIELAEDRGSFDILLEALDVTNLDEVLRTSGPFTLFAPTDTAFNNFLDEMNINEDQLMEQPDLVNLLLYHVILGDILLSDLNDGDEPGTLNGETITVDRTSGVKINDARITRANLMASNGVIHVIDKILVPSDFTLYVDDEYKNIGEIVEDDDNFDILNEALEKANLKDFLETDGPFTLFAPTDAAFLELLNDLDISKKQLLEQPDLSRLLLYHILLGNILSTDLNDGDEPGTLNGQELEVDIVSGDIMIDNAEIITPNIAAANGVIHGIDKVLLPSNFELVLDDDDDDDDDKDIIDIVENNDNFDILVEALEQANLKDFLETDGPFTLFAPTDRAFLRLLNELDITKKQLLEQPDLSRLLLYHVLLGDITSNDLDDGDEPTTINGEELEVDIVSGDIMINDAKVIDPDNEASNGVIHVIDKILIPSNFDLFIFDDDDDDDDDRYGKGNNRPQYVTDKLRELLKNVPAFTDEFCPPLNKFDKSSRTKGNKGNNGNGNAFGHYKKNK